MPYATLLKVSLGKSPIPTIPEAAVQRMASAAPLDELLSPTTLDPSAETAHARLEKSPPDKSPNPTIPFVAVQRNASGLVPEFAETPWPTITCPSAEMPKARLEKVPPAKSPSP